VDGKSDDKEIADLFELKFSMIGQNVADNNPVDCCIQPQNNIIVNSDWLISVEDVDKTVFDKMKRGKAAGMDNLSLEHVVYSHPSLIVHLSNLFNLMIKHGHVPDQFGLGIVVPLIKNKNGDLCQSDNYRGITVSPVISKIFETCLYDKFHQFLASHDLQLGFKKGVGCGPAVFTVQQIVKYFTSRGSSVFITAVDASKAFDRVNHVKLVTKLQERNVPACLINVISSWYNKLYSVVRWNGTLSKKFQVRCGVRQGGILSPILFNIYVDDLIDSLQRSGYGCYVKHTFFGCIMYADDLIIMSPSLHGLQNLLDLCSVYGNEHDIIFNPTKTVCLVVGPGRKMFKSDLFLCGQCLPWVKELKYLGVNFVCGDQLEIDVVPVKRSFYAACNSIFQKCSSAAEPVKLQLVKSFCEPLLTYCLGAVELNTKAVHELSVCWNDAFRKIFHYHRWESVKHLQFFCGDLDFVHLYDSYRWKFLCELVNKFAYVSTLSNVSVFGIFSVFLKVGTVFGIGIAKYRGIGIGIINIISKFRYFRYLFVGTRYFSVFPIPMSVSVSVF
jgi:hypothetical protein